MRFVLLIVGFLGLVMANVAFLALAMTMTVEYMYVVCFGLAMWAATWGWVWVKRDGT